MIEELVNEDLILILDSCEDKFKLIEKMLDKALSKGLIMTREPILHKIREREELESTGVVEGIAIPHARTEAVKDLLLVISVVKDGVDFQSLDGKPVFIIFLIVAPEEAKKKYINVLARISRMCRQSDFREEIKTATSSSEILDVIKDYDL